MQKSYLFTAALSMIFILSNCSRRTTPDQSTSRSVYGTNKPVATGSSKPVATKKIKTPVPKVIVVNDSAASKTFDGRYY